MSEQFTRYLFGTTRGFMILLLVAAGPVVMATMATMSALQAKYVPIVVDFVVTERSADADGNVIISGSFEKVFPGWLCEFQAIKWYMPTVSPGGRVSKPVVHAEYMDKMPHPADNNRPDGHQDFYGWRIFTSKYPELNFVTGYVSHDCGVGWFKLPTRTYIPPIDVPRW